MLLLAPLIAILMLSCEKDEVKVYAGKYDLSFIYYKYSPVLEFTFIRDEQTSSNIGKDSIDIDLDSKYDIFITLKIFDSFFSNCILELKNGFEVVICKESYGVGHGQSATAIFVDTLIYGEGIYKHMDWSADQYDKINMWHESPGPGFMAPSYGSWYYARDIKYIGIKSNSDKYGWIEVDVKDPYSPRINRYAIQQ